MLIRRHREVVLMTLSLDHFLHLFYLNVDDSLYKCCDIILRQMIDVIVPVADPALLLPLCQLARIVASKVTHEDIQARLVG